MFGSQKPRPATLLSPQEAHRLAAAGAILLVDVREAAEWAEGRVPGAVHAPLSSLADHIATLPTERPIVFYCLGGARSGNAVELCRKLGLPHDRHVAGGIRGWSEAGLPVER